MVGRPEYLFFDTETSDLFQPALPLDDPSQPWCVTAAAELTDRDGNPVDHFFCHIRSEGRQIRAGAEAVHGITNRQAGRLGVSEIVVLGMLCGLAAQASFCVGHQIEFDQKIIHSLLLRRKKDTQMWTRPGLEFLCTSRTATEHCKLIPDPPRDDGRYKWPTLDEACSILLKEPPREGHHNAWDDMQRSKRLFFKLRELGVFEGVARDVA